VPYYDYSLRPRAFLMYTRLNPRRNKKRISTLKWAHSMCACVYNAYTYIHIDYPSPWYSAFKTLSSSIIAFSFLLTISPSSPLLPYLPVVISSVPVVFFFMEHFLVLYLSSDPSLCHVFSDQVSRLTVMSSAILGFWCNFFRISIFFWFSTV
jgi:hypothetical protein